MTRSELIAKIARQTGTPIQKAEEMLDCMVGTVTDCLLRGEKVTIAGFGRFEMRTRKSKAYTNPKTKQQSQLEPGSIPGFKASGLFKERLKDA